jgi:HK97 family phage portal protein
VLALSTALHGHALATMQRGARLSGVLSTPKYVVVDLDDVDRIRDEISSTWVGDENAGRVAFVTGGLRFAQLSMPLSDAQFIEQRQMSAQEIARIFRLPPWMIGAPSGDSMTYANVEAQAQAFVTFSLRPWLVVIEQALSLDRDLMPQTMYVEFPLDGLLRADSRTRAEIYTAALNPETGCMTRDEVRRLENLEPEARTS